LTYHAQAKELSVFLGSYEVQKTSTGDEVPTLQGDLQLEQKTWDEMKDVYPYAEHLDSYQPISYENSNIGELLNGMDNYKLAKDPKDVSSPHYFVVHFRYDLFF